MNYKSKNPKITFKNIVDYMEKQYDYINGFYDVFLYLKNKYGADKALEIDLNTELKKIWGEIKSYIDETIDYDILFRLEKLFLIREKIIFIIHQYQNRNNG